MNWWIGFVQVVPQPLRSYTLYQRGPNIGKRAACGPRTVFVRPANAFRMPYITQSHNYIVLATQPSQVIHHWSAGQYV